MWKRKSVWKGLVAGLVGGLAASCAMNQFQAIVAVAVVGSHASWRRIVGTDRCRTSTSVLTSGFDPAGKTRDPTTPFPCAAHESAHELMNFSSLVLTSSLVTRIRGD